MLVTGYGLVTHHFWGEYQGEVSIHFDSEAIAEAAHRRLHEMKLDKNYLHWIGSSDKLAELKQKLHTVGIVKVNCGWLGCNKTHEIDGVPHSIDYGPRWSLTIEVEDPRQAKLL